MTSCQSAFVISSRNMSFSTLMDLRLHRHGASVAVSKAAGGREGNRRGREPAVRQQEGSGRQQGARVSSRTLHAMPAAGGWQLAVRSGQARSGRGPPVAAFQLNTHSPLPLRQRTQTAQYRQAVLAGAYLDAHGHGVSLLGCVHGLVVLLHRGNAAQVDATLQARK